MRPMMRRFRQTRRFQRTVLVLAAAAYNNWLLGGWLNSNLYGHDGSVSEFSISSQPYHTVFRALDITAGLLLIAAAILFVDELSGTRRGRAVLILTGVMGAANILDAVFTLPCSETLSRTCQVPVHLSLSHFQLPSHAYSSVVIAACYFLLPLAGWLWALKLRLKYLSAVSFTVVAVSMLSFVSVLVYFVRHHNFSVHASGIEQEIQMAIFSLWLIVFYWIVTGRRMAQHEKTPQEVSGP